MIRIACPITSEHEKRNVCQVLDSGMLASGEWVREFESRFAEYHGTTYGVATTSGTTALHTALASVGVGPGDAVLVPTFTFIASVNSILHCGAIPVFVDVDEKTFNLDPASLVASVEKARREHLRLKAILVVHLFGLACPMEEILEIAQTYGLRVVEDCAQAHGAAIDGKRVGSFGDAAAFSFYPTKNMTTGEGGIVLTNDEKIEQFARKFINHGRAERYLHDQLGYNYRMTNIAAAIGLAQLERLDEFNDRRRQNAAFFNEHLGDVPYLSVPYTPPGYHHVFHQYTLKIPNSRDSMQQWLTQQGIGTAVIYPLPIHKQPLYVQLGLDQNPCPVAEYLATCVLSIPVHPLLTSEELTRIVRAIRRFPGEASS